MTGLIEAPARRTSLASGALFTRASWPLLIACAAGCYKLDDDDHRLRETGGLFSLYADTSEACLPCLRKECRSDAMDCANEAGCKKAMECQGAANPAAYRECLNGLYAQDASSPNDPNGAWEGTKGTLRSCIELNCREQCKRNVSDWSCRGDWSSVPGYNERELVLSVKLFDYDTVPNVIVQTCTDLRYCDDGGVKTSEAGTAHVKLQPGTDRPYFKIIMPDDYSGDQVPPTFYYPTHLDNNALQPVSIYLISTQLIEITHGRLGLDAGVLNHVAQSLILPDACREQSKPSATEVTVHVEGWTEPMPQCQDEAIKHGRLEGPCVWYADAQGVPMAGLMHTMGMGAGILGLDKGTHVVRVCDRESKRLLARREVYMEPGALTVARTWPLTEEEMAAGEECFTHAAPP